MKKIYTAAITITFCFLGRLEAMEVPKTLLTPNSDLGSHPNDVELGKIMQDLFRELTEDNVAQGYTALQSGLNDCNSSIDDQTICRAAKLIASLLGSSNARKIASLKEWLPLEEKNKPGITTDLIETLKENASSVLALDQFNQEKAILCMQPTMDACSPHGTCLFPLIPGINSELSELKVEQLIGDENSVSLEMVITALSQSNAQDRTILMLRLAKELEKELSTLEVLGFTEAINLDDDSQKECLIQ
ncbi:hypothetical protein H0W26_04110 [Candidatus Dependentiae bacterium]|nr:hypothetical protein [Candidatus Dependentiae bacterium]